MADTIYLDPDLFMALGLSAEEFGGIGAGAEFVKHKPLCIIGHAWNAGRAIPEMGECPYSMLLESSPGTAWGQRNDVRLAKAGVARFRERVPFAEWCRIVGVDVAEGS